MAELLVPWREQWGDCRAPAGVGALSTVDGPSGAPSKVWGRQRPLLPSCKGDADIHSLVEK